MALKRPAMQTMRRIEARYWPTAVAPVGCFFCQKENMPYHVHIKRPKARAA